MPDRILQACIPAFGGSTIMQNTGDILKLFNDIIGGSVCIYDIVFFHAISQPRDFGVKHILGKRVARGNVRRTFAQLGVDLILTELVPGC